VAAAARALDVGCATGYLGAELAARGCAVVGVEADPAAAAAATASGGSERVVNGDVESVACRAELRALAPFDAVVCGDVLEHRREPWATLAFLATLLAPDGRAAVSVPNVAHWTARRALLLGRFPYAEHGLFDRTHLRFFTRASARALVEGAGLRVLAERFAPAPVPLQPRLPVLARFERVAARAWPELFALQFVLVAPPALSAPSTPARASR
jgi:SAM-dependent methyltransferase